MRLIDADRLKEQVAERIRTPRSTMEIKKDILPLLNAQPDASDLDNLEWSLSYLIWQQIQQSGSRATLQERNKGGDAVGEDDKGKIESVSEQ